MAFSDSETQQLAKVVAATNPVHERWHAGWHVKKEIQVTHIISTVTLALSAVWYVGKLEQRIAILEQKDATRDQAVREALSLLRQDLSMVNAKIDRLIEREARK